jgi:hypothetical protein
MAPHDPEVLRDRGKSLEDEFFRREDQRLLARLQELQTAEMNREALAKASGITKTDVLDKLLQLGIRAETLAALSIVPLVEVAWADGTLDAKERRAVLDHAADAGIAGGSTAAGLLEAWLERRPERRLLQAWTELVHAIREQVGPEESARLRTELVDRARAVARASGGVLGMGSKVSSAEGAMLAQLEGAFGTKR